METDQHDPYSLHVIVRHRSSGLAAGCTRIIPARPVGHEPRLPIEKLYADLEKLSASYDRQRAAFDEQLEAIEKQP